MTQDEAFERAGYYPTLCHDHDIPHAVNRDPRTGDMRCTAGCVVLPVVREDIDRLGDFFRDALQREVDL